MWTGRSCPLLHLLTSESAPCLALPDPQAAAAEAEDQLDLMFNALGRAADEAQRQLAACGHLRAELARRQAGVQAAQARLEATRVRQALEGQQLGSLQQKVGV